MELLLQAHLAGEPLDVRVEVDETDSIAQLAAAVAAFGRLRGVAVSADATSCWTRDGVELLPDKTVGESELVNGDALYLGAPPPGGAAAVRDGGVAFLDVASGPETGRFVPLGRGTYRVGRDESSDVVLEDPTLSRHHLTVHVRSQDDVVVEPNPAATNGTFVGDREMTSARTIEPRELVHAGATSFAVRPADVRRAPRRDLLGQIPFNRVPYRRTVVNERSFPPVPAPPARVQATKIALAAAFIPLVGGVGLAVWMGRPQFLIFALLSPLALIARHFSDKRAGRRSYSRERQTFLARIEARAAEVEEAIEAERRERLTAAPDLAALGRQVEYLQMRLWERHRDAADFLSLRLGLGTVESKVDAGIDRGGDPELRDSGTKALARQETVSSVPIVAEMSTLHTFGLFGEGAVVDGIGRSLTLQTACLHSPEDLVVAAALPQSLARELDWLKWLPHTRAATSPLDGPHLASGSEETRDLLLRLLAVAGERVQRKTGGAVASAWPRLLLVLHEGAEPDRALLAQLLDVAPAAGIATIWLGRDELLLPRHCWATLRCVDPLIGSTSLLQFIDPTVTDREVEVETASLDAARNIATALAPVRDASAATLTTAIPRQVHLLDTVRMPDPTPEEVIARWRSPRAYGLRAPLGQGADGPLHLDLVDDGPHALIAGTSGSGKSELLQTLVASLVAHYPPSRLNFLFIDYKGGASSSEFRELPHAVGYVTNLSGALSMRALASLRAELKRRMALLEGRAKDLAEMIDVAPDEAPPSLVIVVDEFATLVKEIPDFVAGIVDVAQRGRSLGIHLVLATQRPAGAVNDNILANTNLRIALRVLDPADSTNVIGSKDAADIPVPLRGRAFAKLGPGQLVAFQCAWSGAPLHGDDSRRSVRVRTFDPKGAASPELDVRPSSGGPGAVTQLHAVVSAAADAARRLSLPPAPRPWVEPLPDVVLLQDVLERAAGELPDDPGRVVAFGLVDDPENQAQRAVTIDLERSGGLLVFGTGGAGKTTTLRTIAAALAQQSSPEGIQLYAIDFASRALAALAALPHCAATATGDDPERVTRILTVLGDEVAERRRILGEARADSLSALRAARGEYVMPRLVVLLDGYAGFQAAFDKSETFEWVAQFQRLVSDGRQVGIHVVVATDRRTSVPSALYSAISARLVMRMADPEEMTLLGIPLKVAKETDLAPGRAFLDGGHEVHVATISRDPSGAAQAESLAALADRLTRQAPGRARALPELPENVSLTSPFTLGPSGALRVPIAVEDLSLETLHLDLTRSHAVVAGPPASGKSTALSTLAAGVKGAGKISLFAVGGPGSPLASANWWEDSAFARSRHAAVLESLLGSVDETAYDGAVRAVLFVDEADDVDEAAARMIEQAVRLDSVRVVAAGSPATVSKGYSGWMGELRRNRSVLLLQPENRAEVEQLTGAKMKFRPGQEFPPGRGVFVGGRRAALVQVAKSVASATASRT